MSQDHVEGPKLPEDITPLAQQINRMRNSNLPQESSPGMPDDQFPTSTSENNISPEHNINQGNPDNSHNLPEREPDESQDESLQQSDQESSQGDQAEPATEKNDPDRASEAAEMVMLTCHEPDNALAHVSREPTAWRCEFEVPINRNQNTPNECSEEDAWIFLAT